MREKIQSIVVVPIRYGGKSPATETASFLSRTHLEKRTISAVCWCRDQDARKTVVVVVVVVADWVNRSQILLILQSNKLSNVQAI